MPGCRPVFCCNPGAIDNGLFVLPLAARVADVVLKSEIARELASLDQPARYQQPGPVADYRDRILAVLHRLHNSARIFIHAQVIRIYNASRQKNCVEVFGFHLADLSRMIVPPVSVIFPNKPIVNV